MPPKTEPSAVVIPFGKHKGRTVAELLATDPQYADWLLAQGWLAERFAELHSAIQTRGAGADDTPEHNAIQGRFLDPLFRAAFVLLTQDTAQAAKQDHLDLTWSEREAVQKLQSTVEWRRNEIVQHTSAVEEAKKENRYGSWGGVEFWQQQLDRSKARFPEAEANLAAAKLALAAVSPLPLKTSVAFEQRGVDVRLLWGFCERPNNYDRGRELRIEIKPSMGEDYPTVMRQMQRLSANYLVLDSYTGRALPFETVRSMFQATGLTVVTVREIEAEIPNARSQSCPPGSSSSPAPGSTST